MTLFMLRGTGDARWLPSIADEDLKFTVAEWNAGQPLGLSINAIEGLDPQSNKINVAILKKKVEEQIDGPQTFQDASITIAEDDGTGTNAEATERQEVLTVLVKGASGYLVLNRTSQDAPAAGGRFWVMGATVADQVPNWSLDAAAATTQVRLSPSTPMTPVVVSA